MGFLAWLFGRRRAETPQPPVATAPPTPRPLPPAATGPAVGSSDYWNRLDLDAVNRYTSANIRRLEASRRGDVAGAAEAQREYDMWFARHREYRSLGLQAEAREAGRA